MIRFVQYFSSRVHALEDFFVRRLIGVSDVCLKRERGLICCITGDGEALDRFDEAVGMRLGRGRCAMQGWI